MPPDSVTVEQERRALKRRQSPLPSLALPFWVIGPDIHGPTVYRRCRTLKVAKKEIAWAYKTAGGNHLSVLRVVIAPAPRAWRQAR